MSLKPGDVIAKDPDSIEPYSMDWTAWLAGLIDTAGEDTIDTSTWTVSGADASLAFQDDSIVTGGLKTQLRLTGGTAGEDYQLTNHIITASGAEDDRSVTIRVKER